MKKSIKVLSLVLVLVLIASCFVLVACNNNKNETQPTLGAYTLSDKGTFLSYKKNVEGDKVPNLEILFESADDMKNIYSMEAIVQKGEDTKKDTTKGEKDDTVDWKRTINTKGADAFIHWMSTANTRQLIASYGIVEYEEALFSLIDDTSVVYSGIVETYDADAEDIKKVVAQTTSSVKDSGLLVYLEPLFEAATGFDLDVKAAATGAAIENAKNGDADLILVHSKSAEKSFIDTGLTREVSGIANTKAETGYESRITFMYNYFVIVGSATDPAGVKGSENAAAAFKKIYDAKCNFVSRVDASGTYNHEIKLWKAAGITDIYWNDTEALPVYNNEYTWYIAAKNRMGACLIKANETYTK